MENVNKTTKFLICSQDSLELLGVVGVNPDESLEVALFLLLLLILRFLN